MSTQPYDDNRPFVAPVAGRTGLSRDTLKAAPAASLSPIVSRPDWLPERVWPFEIRTVHVDGLPIVYTDEGAGPVLLLVHDGMWSYVWGAVIERLRRRFRVITLDFPGAGLSPHAGRAPGLETDSRLLSEFVHALGLERVTLVVHDLGGPVGLGWAVSHPEAIQGLVLSQTFAWPPHTWMLRTALRVISSSPVEALNVRTNLIPQFTASRGGIGRHLDTERRRAFLGGFRTAAQRRRFHSMLRCPLHEAGFLAATERTLSTTLADKPALLIFGERNDPFGFRPRLEHLLSHSEAMIVQAGNHFPMADDPEGFAQRLTEWHGRTVAPQDRV